MPSNAPYSSDSNPTGAVPVRLANSQPGSATLPRFVQTNPFDTNNNGVVDAVDAQPMANVIGLNAALTSLQAQLTALQAQVAGITWPSQIARLGINVYPLNPLKVAAEGGVNSPWTAQICTPEGYARVLLGTKSDGSGVVTVLRNDGTSMVVLDAQTGQVLVNGNPVPALVNGVLPPNNLASGTALQVLRRNAANTGLEFASLNTASGVQLAPGVNDARAYNNQVHVSMVPAFSQGSVTTFPIDADAILTTLQVFRNGVLLRGGVEHDYYTATGSVTLTRAFAAQSELLRVFYWRGTPANQANI